MTYRQAKKLRVGDKVNAKKFLLNEFITPIQITKIQTEEKDIFISDENQPHSLTVKHSALTRDSLVRIQLRLPYGVVLKRL